jgi:hypothetical protein
MLRPLFALSSILLFALPPLHARIGESRSGIEGRLLSSGGIEYRDEAMINERRKGKPYMKFQDQMPSSAELVIYFKSIDGREPSSADLRKNRLSSGWDLHVLYVNGRSVMELYERKSGISDYELNQLLALNAGGSYWQRHAENEEKEVSAFDYDMVRADGAIRAKKLGDKGVLIVSAEFDSRLAEVRDSDLQQKAPISIQGF